MCFYTILPLMAFMLTYISPGVDLSFYQTCTHMYRCCIDTPHACKGTFTSSVLLHVGDPSSGRRRLMGACSFSALTKLQTAPARCFSSSRSALPNTFWLTMQCHCRFEAFAAYNADCAALTLTLCVLQLMTLPFSSQCKGEVQS